jgi:putative ABC transport system permease protein
VKWLEKTRGPQFELSRHFLRRMFEGEWSSSPGQWKSAAIAAVALFLPGGLLLVREGAMNPGYASKYRLLEMAAGTEGLRAAALADEIALVTLLLCVTGLIALLEWQSLFPGRRDYLAMASLPVRPRHVFAARFTSVLLFSAVIITAMNILPSLIGPIEFGGGWQIDAGYCRQAGAQALASGLACFFAFFAIIALQGVLLNVLPARHFARISVYAQGALAGLFLLGGLYSWSMKEWKPEVIARLTEFGAWLPPVWFAGLHRTLVGDGDLFAKTMAATALIAAGFAVMLAIGTYFISYRRYRKLLLESPVQVARRRWGWNLARLLARSPRQEAVIDFMVKTLVRNRTHRLLWFVYLGAAAAVLVNSSLVDGAIFVRSRRISMALQFVVHFWPLACTVVVLNGFRHVLSIPAELRANWIFRITEGQGRAEWMTAVERFVIAFAIAPIYLMLFPVAGKVLGWPLAARMTVLQVVVSLSMFEALFYSWQKLPFTCSHIPGDKPLVAVLGRYLALLGAFVPFLSVIIAVTSQMPALFFLYLPVFVALWLWLRKLRRDGWGETKLIYEDLPAVVTDLGIKELTYGGTEAQLRRTAARNAGHADFENAGSRSDARVRGGGIHPTDIRGRTARGGGSALPGAASFGTARAADLGMGSFGEQPAGQVLPALRRGTQATRRRGGSLAEDFGSDRADYGAGLAKLPFGETLAGTWSRLRTLFHRKQLERDLEDELQFHLAMRQERFRAAGVHDASQAAHRQFGNVDSLKDACRDVWTFVSVDALWQDVRYGLRQLRLNRGFTVAAALTLSLGIAATTLIYSVCSALVWKALPLPDPDSLVTVLEAFPGNPHFWAPSSAADVEDFRKSDTLLTDLASWDNATANLVDLGGEPLRVDQARVSANFFEVLGVVPQLGHTFARDQNMPGREREVVLSDRLWRDRFRADPGILGRSVRINEVEYIVIGVMPPKFAFPRASKELWTPLALTAEERTARNTPRLDSVGRLRPGHTLAQVQSELDALALRLEKLYPATNTKRRFMAWSAHRYVAGDYAAQFARLLLGAALFILSIACVNVANLQFARGTARWREVALRLALGASRSRIVAQLVTESIVLALAGAGLGIVLARFGLHAIRDGMPNELQKYSSGWTDLGLNMGVLLFVLAAAVLSGIIAGLAPALRSSRPNLTESLKEGGHSSEGPGRHRIRSFLLAAEIALTVVLLVGAGLMIHGFQALVDVKTTIEPATLLTLRLEIDAATHRSPEQVTAFFRQVLEKITVLPGVQVAAVASALPYSRHARYSAFVIQGKERQSGKLPGALLQTVSPDYFRTMRIPLRAGRLLSDRDGPRTSLSAVISEEAARQWWMGEPLPIGKQIHLGDRNKNGPWITVVGVVGGVKSSIMERYPGPTIYVPHTQFPERGMDVAIRSGSDPLSQAAAVRLAIKAVDAEEPVTDLMTLENVKRNEAIGLTYAAAIMTVFGGVALLLSCVGIYGTTAYIVSRQTHEIGIRKALGAGSWTLLIGIFSRSAQPVFAGVTLGLFLSFVLARILASVIWGVSPTDLSTFVGVPLLLDLAAGLAIYIPARRAIRIDPSVALRNE